MAGSSPQVTSRYAIYDEIAAGGMATVHFGRVLGAAGFSRSVAIKRLHPQFARDPEFVSMFIDEGRLAARIRHPNVVSTLDVVAGDGELFLVMEYVPGESLSGLLRQAHTSGQRVPPRIAAAIIAGVLGGLHAAHHAKDEEGRVLDIVHRDVSPQNVLVGTDGIPRLLDFGIAKAAHRVGATREGQLKGKLSYMAPELFDDGDVGKQTDVYSAAVVLWELITGERLFKGKSEAATIGRILEGAVMPPSRLVSDVSGALDEVVLKGLARNVNARYSTARQMRDELVAAVTPAPPEDVGEWVERIADVTLQRRADTLSAIERQKRPDDDAPTPLSQPNPLRSEAMTVVQGRSSLGLDGSHTELMMMGRATSTTLGKRRSWAFPLAVVLLVVAGGLWTTGAISGGTPSSLHATGVAAAANVVVGIALDRAAIPRRVMPPPPPIAVTPATTSSVPKPRPTAIIPQPKADPCDPPYTIRNGIREVKRHCL